MVSGSLEFVTGDLLHLGRSSIALDKNVREALEAGNRRASGMVSNCRNCRVSPPNGPAAQAPRLPFWHPEGVGIVSAQSGVLTRLPPTETSSGKLPGAGTDPKSSAAVSNLFANHLTRRDCPVSPVPVHVSRQASPSLPGLPGTSIHNRRLHALENRRPNFRRSWVPLSILAGRSVVLPERLPLRPRCQGPQFHKRAHMFHFPARPRLFEPLVEQLLDRSFHQAAADRLAASQT